MQIQQLPTSTLPRYFLRKPLRAKRYYDRLWLLMRDINFMVAIVPVMTEIWTMRNVRARAWIQTRASRTNPSEEQRPGLVRVDVIASLDRRHRERESARAREKKNIFYYFFFPSSTCEKKIPILSQENIPFLYWKCPHFIEISKKVAPFSELFLTFNRPLKEYLDIYTYTDNGRLSN